MFCKNCGKELLSDEKYCSGCGKSVLSEQISYTNGQTAKKDKGKGKITGIVPGLILIVFIVLKLIQILLIQMKIKTLVPILTEHLLHLMNLIK